MTDVYAGVSGAVIPVFTRNVFGYEVQAVECPPTGTLANGTEIAVDDTDTELVTVNASRKGLIIENRGSVTVRIGGESVTWATGHSLAAGAQEAFSEPYCPTSTVHAICNTGQTATVFVQEVTG